MSPSGAVPDGDAARFELVYDTLSGLAGATDDAGWSRSLGLRCLVMTKFNNRAVRRSIVETLYDMFDSSDGSQV